MKLENMMVYTCDVEHEVFLVNTQHLQILMKDGVQVHPLCPCGKPIAPYAEWEKNQKKA